MVHNYKLNGTLTWLKLVERWFRELPATRMRRGVLWSVADLITAIEKYIVAFNAHPKPLVWTKPAGVTLAKVSEEM
jgi:hypothetical protein